MIRSVLVADDDALARDFLCEFLADKGYSVRAACDAAEAFRMLCESDADLVLSDLRMPGDDGLTLLRRIRATGREVPVVLITAYGSVETAVRALKEGATDFISKPLSPERVESVLESVQGRMLANAPLTAPAAQRESNAAPPIVGKSRKLRELVETAIRVARSRATVLITGESGTGKELIARLIHEESPRHAKPFVRVNCAALAETLLESELFGHEKGAFTGAMQRREGRFELADGGTLFLDEIGETSPALQAKLLRVLEEREFERVGGAKTIATDVRVIAATNRDLERAIEAGEFREDLFYRLQVVSLRIPPLRERREDIAPLVEFFVTRAARENNSRVRGVSKDALAALTAYHWPGNVRELENTIERAVVLDPGETLEREHISVGENKSRGDDLDVSRHVGRSLDELERAMILRTLESTNQSRKEAARLLGVTSRTLTNKIARYRKLGIEVGPPRKSAQRAATAIEGGEA